MFVPSFLFVASVPEKSYMNFQQCYRAALSNHLSTENRILNTHARINRLCNDISGCKMQHSSVAAISYRNFQRCYRVALSNHPSLKY